MYIDLQSGIVADRRSRRKKKLKESVQLDLKLDIVAGAE
jgi:hypothetical protein